MRIFRVTFYVLSKIVTTTRIAKTNYDHWQTTDELIVPPYVVGFDGVVLRTNDNLIAISLGAGDGIKAGDTATVFRGSKYIGRAQVTTAKTNMSVARMIDSQSKVEEGDSVSLGQ